MKTRKSFRVACFGMSVLVGGAGLTVQSADATSGFTALQPAANSAIIREVMRLYNVDESAAVERMSAEAQASVKYARVPREDLEGYAGAWFDPQALDLVVATTADSDWAVINRIGARTVSVRWSLQELESIRSDVDDELVRSEIGSKMVYYSYVDVVANRVIVGVDEGLLATAQAFWRENEAIKIVVGVQPVLNTGAIRGAEGTRNHSWEQQFPGIHPCSTAVAVNGGFLTAGHCTVQLDPFASPQTIHTASGELLGYTRFSTSRPWGYLGSKDIAWVETVPGWTPLPEYNGYQAGIKNVPAEWGGIQEAPISSTVCRYGQTSGGPHCGTLTALNVSVLFENQITMHGVMQVNGTCTSDGDSGGPHVMASTGQIQGINMGGATPCAAGSNPSGIVYAQPIRDGINFVNGNSGYPERVVLTSHGPVPPSVQGLVCSPQGAATFFCQFQSFRSQGPTGILWQWSHGSQPDYSMIFGSCTEGAWSTVSLTLSNMYGNVNTSASFVCLGGPPL